jgi:hypothetical protein
MLSVTSVFGQTAKGVVSGRTVASVGRILQGAKVELQSVGASTVCGEFTINRPAPAEYILTVTFVGLAPFEKMSP